MQIITEIGAVKKMSGKLFVVGTPIGNLSDLSFRAKDTLEQVDYIACEDTRHSVVLLNHYGIKKPLISYHKFKEREATERIMLLLREGKQIALISDAGMPCICDPGSILVKSARDQGFEVESVPGPTALTTAVAISGIKESSFIFLGFLPEKESFKRKLLSEFSGSSLPIIIYCAPHDIQKTVNFLLEEIGDRQVVMVKEISKMFENVVSGKLSDINLENIKGEYVLIIMPVYEKVSEKSIQNELAEARKKGYKKSEAVKLVADKLGVPKNDVYSLSLDAPKRKQ